MATQTTSSGGLAPNVAGALSYLLGFVTGILFYLLSKDKFVRFHAMQSIILFLGLTILNYILAFTIILALLTPIIGLISLILWILLMVKAYRNEKYKLPVVGNIAEKYA